MKAIVKFFLIVLVLALFCSAFFGFSEAEDVEGDKSFIDNIKDSWENLIDTIFPGDKDDVKDPDGNGNNDNVNQTHNSMHFSQGSAAKLRYITPKCEGHWQSINVLSGEHFLCYMVPDTYISFKNVGSESIFIGTAWKKGVFLEIPAGSETSNLDFSFSKDWWFWTATEHKPSDEELKANKTVISFTAEAGNELTIYDDFDNNYSGKGKTSIELEIGKEYTFTSTSKTLLLGSDFNSMVIAEIYTDHIFKFTPSTDKYAIWVKAVPEEEDPYDYASTVYLHDSMNECNVVITDGAGNNLSNGDSTIHYDIDVESYTDCLVYCSNIGYFSENKVLVSSVSHTKFSLHHNTPYYFWAEPSENAGGDESYDSYAYIVVTENAQLANFCLKDGSGNAYTSSFDIPVNISYQIEGTSALRMSTIGIGGSDGYQCNGQLMRFEAGCTYYFYTEADLSPD